MSGGFQYKQSAADSATASRANTAPVAEDDVQKTRIVYIERKYWRKDFLAFSIEKVFEQVARLLPAAKFRSELVKVPHGNTFLDILRNLAFFKRPAADIYHITGQIHYMALVLPKERTVLTIHDLAFLESGATGGLRRFIIKKLFLDLPVRRARYVTAVSETTKNAIVANTKCDSNDIRVIHDPIQEQYLSGARKQFNKQRPTILQIGITENKNIPRLLESLKGIDCQLKIVGNMTPELRSKLDRSGVDYISVLGLNDKEMRAAYEEADIVSFCSTYEGFGLPIIEAQSMCTPVLTSDLEPMKEVSGGAAYLADPYDVKSIRDGVLKIINDEAFREELIDRGLENSKRFDPRAIAAQYSALYDEIFRS
jgi:glycosyltransferase involved in cell wall biosynthesis